MAGSRFAALVQFENTGVDETGRLVKPVEEGQHGLQEQKDMVTGIKPQDQVVAVG